MENLDDIGDMMIEEDSVVNQLGVFGNNEHDRRRNNFDDTGEKLLEGFEAVRDRPGKEKKRGQWQNMRNMEE